MVMRFVLWPGPVYTFWQVRALSGLVVGFGGGICE
jgi:hypothetical protein